MFGPYDFGEVNPMSKEAWFDMAITQCPNCGRPYADASWDIVEMSSDIECGRCHETFSTRVYLTDRIMLNIKLNGKGKAEVVEMAGHI